MEKTIIKWDVDSIMWLIDAYSNLDWCYEELREWLLESYWEEPIEEIK